MSLTAALTTFLVVLPAELPDKTIFACLILASRYPSRVKIRTAAAINSGSRSCASRLPVMPRIICVSKWLTYTTKRNRQETLSSARAPGPARAPGYAQSAWILEPWL